MPKQPNRFLGIERFVQRWADGQGPRGAGERVLAGALRAASAAWWAGASARSAAFDLGVRRAKRVDCPVICIGNLSVGGTGKTPMVIETARLLAASGRRVAVVSRGYRRAPAAPGPGSASASGRVVVVSDGRGTIRASREEAGDEPAMIARALPEAAVVVGADRYEAALEARQALGADVVVLDDGFQHRALARDCDIVLWDALRSADAAAFLPRGLMREGLRALRRAHALVFTRCNLAGSIRPFMARVKRIAPHLAVFRANTEAKGLSDPLDPAQTFSPEVLRGRRVAAWCGLGNPVSFWKTLESLGAEVVASRVFPDHYAASAAELGAFLEEAARQGAEWGVTTEKDAQNLPAPWAPPIPTRVLGIETTLGADTERFARFVESFL